MPELLGAQTILDLVPPTGWDTAKLNIWLSRSNLTWDGLIGDAALAVAGLNQEMLDKFGHLIYVTEEPAFEYPNGYAVTKANKTTDVSKTDGVRAETIGHMVDLDFHESAYEISFRAMQNIRASVVNAGIGAMVGQIRERLEWELFWRLFVDTDKQVGSSGYNVSFVKTGGSVTFTPMAYGGQNFSGHSHYRGYDSDAPGNKTWGDMLDDLAETVAEHGHEAPFTAMVPYADRATIRGLNNFVQPIAPVIQNIDRGGSTSGAQFFTQGNPMIVDGIFGYYNSPAGIVELRASARVPSGYGSVFKSYGRNNVRNPLYVRVRPGKGFGAYLVTQASNRSDYPIDKMIAASEFGVTVGMDRTNGAVGKLSTAGTWSNPTIS